MQCTIPPPFFTPGHVALWELLLNVYRKTGVDEIEAEDTSVSLRKPSPCTRAPAAQVLSPCVSCAATACRSQGWTRIINWLCCLISKVKASVCHDLWLSFQPILFYTFWKFSLWSGEIARLFWFFSLFWILTMYFIKFCFYPALSKIKALCAC